MSKIHIVGPKGLLDECISVLHALGILHVETSPVDLTLEEGLERLPIERERAARKEALEKALDRLENLQGLLKGPQTVKTADIAGKDISRYLEEVAPVEEGARALHSRMDALREELASVGRYERILGIFAAIISRFEGLNNFETVGLTLDRQREGVVRLLEGEVNRITSGAYEIHIRDIDKDTLGIVLAYPKMFDSEVRHIITGEGINEIRLPGEYERMPLLDAMKRMTERKKRLPEIMAGVSRELDELSERWYGTVISLQKAVQDAIDEIGILTCCTHTRFAFILEGYVPRDMMEALKGAFFRLFNERVLVRELEIREKEMDAIPVCIKNPDILKPFEIFLTVLPTPRYGSVDPTPFMAIFFPVFFGLIVGDMGYGAILLILGVSLRRRFRGKRFWEDALSVLSICAASSIFFGFLFGELFGDLGERLNIVRPVLLDRVRALKTFLALALGIGVGHVALGLFIALGNHLSRGRTREAAGKLASILLLLSFLAVLGIMWKLLPKDLLTAGLVALFASLAALTVIEGLMGPLEFIRAIGNILSYARIMAVGAVSVIISLAANRIGGLAGSLFAGVIAAALIHTLNLLLTLLSPVIQSLRLQYVEFLSKFYVGGGRRYAPFKRAS